MGVGVPGYFNLAVAQPARNFLNVNAVVGQQGGVAVPKIVYANNRQPGCLSVGYVCVENAGVRFTAVNLLARRNCQFFAE